MRAYLTSRSTYDARYFGIGIINLFWLYGTAGQYQRHAPILLLAAMIAALVRAPRCVVYGLTLASLTLTIANDVLIASTGPQDGGSDRDDALEIGCRALLHGENPWTKTTQLGNPISTGPASFLLALPFVFIFGRVNELTTCFWIGVALTILAADVKRRNGVFLLLTPVLQLGLFDLNPTRLWSLEEISYAVLLFPSAWLAVNHGRFATAGLLLSAAFMSRLSYAFPIAGFACWFAWERRAGPCPTLRVLGGFLRGITVIGGFFFFRFHQTIATSNPIGLTLIKASSPLPTGNDLTDGIYNILKYLPHSVSVPARVLIALALTFGWGRLAARNQLRLAI